MNADTLIVDSLSFAHQTAQDAPEWVLITVGILAVVGLLAVLQRLF
jgi:hypothetical protein